MKSRTQYRYALALSILVIAAYCLTNFPLGDVLGGFLGSYGLPILLWGFLAFATVKMPLGRTATKPRFREMFCWLGIMSAVVGIMVAFAAGLLEGLGRSPYDLSLKGIIVNIFDLAFMVVGMELSRAWFLNVLFRKRPISGVALVSLLYSLFWFSPNRVMSISGGLEVARFFGSIYFPALSENVLASYLAFWGGPLPAIAYHGTLMAFRRFMPILPNLSWITQALVGTFVPAFGLVLSHHIFTGEASGFRRKNQETGSPFSWVFTSAISVLMIWFSVGVFSYFPTVIVSGSMTPQICIGDVVIIKRESAEAINVGDVMQFKDDNIRIVHRVVEIEEEQTGRKVFWTKGDANKNRDVDPVMPEQVVGKVVYKIPKAGWLSLLARNRNYATP
jgi:signal peptidase